jgi:hypothetical protein
MKMDVRKVLLTAVCLGLFGLSIPSMSAALMPITLSEDSSIAFYGFFRNNLGMFLDEQPFAQSGNDLATARTWFRAYTDYKINSKLNFWAAVQFVAEPEYDVEDGAVTSTVPRQMAGETEGWDEYSEYDDINDVLRECYIEWKPSRRHGIKIGRQIAIWGEALTSRVGDVVHPEDQRFTLAFANLEDTRIPSWMIRGIHDFSTKFSFEWIYNPNLVENIYTVNRIPTSSNLAAPGQRFAISPEKRFAAPISVTNPALGLPFSIPGVVVGHPFSRDWAEVAPGFFVPTAIPYVKEEYPQGWWEEARGGFRTNTFLGGYSFGVFYFHTQNYEPVVRRGDFTGRMVPSGPPPAPALPEREYVLSHPNMDIFGFYMNKDLTGIPGVFRTEAIYAPNKPFNTFDPTDIDAIDRRDYIKYLLAYDLTNYLYFQWHKDAAFDITFEHTGEWIPDNDDLQYVIYSTRLKEWNPAFNLRIATTWRYGQISTEVITSYLPWGSSGLFMPVVKYTLPWLDQKISAELRYINVFGDDYEGLGILNTKDMIVLTTQFNW